MHNLRIHSGLKNEKHGLSPSKAEKTQRRKNENEMQEQRKSTREGGANGTILKQRKTIQNTAASNKTQHKAPNPPKKTQITRNQKAGPTGIEPAAYGLRVRRSGLTELRARRDVSWKKTFIWGFRGFGLVSCGFSMVGVA